MNKKALVLLYEGMSLSEVTLLTDYLTVFQPCGEWWTIDMVGANKKVPIKTEDSFLILPNKEYEEVVFSEYQVIILTGIMNPYPIAEDEALINFLKPLVEMETRPLIAAISSAPMLLAKAGILKGVAFTSGLFEETLNEFSFFEKEKIVRQPLVYDESAGVVTAIGFAYREFAVKVAQLLGFDLADTSFSGPRKDRAYTPEELTFYMYPEVSK
ncbi:DJ-1/PfpI family protein [Vagococcus hydrophili]|uniref:4-methyl-5(B-hydroxyethyl)-thiazole monophosphate biosynthesis protein n=1 Tax=Vagococcus hydrophili TaxID=2714947 RepID=A0A6G8ARL5_9ENTE|nr:DJ-1/PfpI family protein [Vagococcus hydrophili]QIL47637.1 4-methyl-5(B-hydroxyethyl)-thiazole monophosphate biosynthesis protein [Vagococcus hydrophili]